MKVIANKRKWFGIVVKYPSNSFFQINLFDSVIIQVCNSTVSNYIHFWIFKHTIRKENIALRFCGIESISIKCSNHCAISSHNNVHCLNVIYATLSTNLWTLKSAHSWDTKWSFKCVVGHLSTFVLMYIGFVLY